jgi:photosystem II stability/assembly factor-like uncharacterized protein
MKKIIFVALSILILFGCKKEQIETTEPSTIDGLELTILQPNENYNLRAIHFIDNQTGFASGYNGQLIKSTDGGSTWKELETNTTVPLYGIDFINNNIGFVVGGKSGCEGTGCIPIGAVMLKTTDGGDTWEKITLNLNDKIELKSIHFINASVGFAIGISSILITRDGGNSWEQKIIENLEGTMQKIDFNGTQNGMIICNGGQIISTKDGGNSWEINSTISISGSVSVSLTENNVAYASGNTKIFKSNDFGISWVELTDSPTDNFDINFITKDFGFAIGRGSYSGGDWGHNYGAIFYTTDGGKNWIGNKNIKETGSFHESSFPSENQGYIVSSNKIIKVRKK